MENRGFISLHRKLFENPISSKPNYLAVWIYLLTHANHTPKDMIINNKKIRIDRGCFLGSGLNIAKQFKLSTSSVKKILDYFENDKMLKTTRTRNYTIFQILNYDSYQQGENNAKTTRKQRETTNNDNNDNNKKYTKKPDSVNSQTWDDFIQHRKNKKAPVTKTVITKIENEAKKANWTLEEALQEICVRGWRGFNHAWVDKKTKAEGENGLDLIERAMQ